MGLLRCDMHIRYMDHDGVLALVGTSAETGAADLTTAMEGSYPAVPALLCCLLCLCGGKPPSACACGAQCSRRCSPERGVISLGKTRCSCTWSLVAGVFLMGVCLCALCALCALYVGPCF